MVKLSAVSFVLMSSIPNSVAAACIFLMLAGGASVKAAPQGFMEGHLKDCRDQGG